jgi:PAS domain S-box-containing protein
MNQDDINEKHRLVLSMSPVPLMVVGASGTIRHTNPHFDHLFGYQPGELAGMSVEILVPDEIAAVHPELREAFFDLPTDRSMGTGRDLFGKHKDGHRIPIEIGLKPIDDEGDDDTMVLVSVVDITERMNNENRVRLALDASASAMIMIDDHGRIVLTNAGADIMFGYPKDALIGRPVEDLVPDRFRRKHSVYRTSYLSVRERRDMGSGRELFGLRFDQSEFPIEIGLTPIDGADGRRVVATINDITERKARDDLIRQKNAALTQLNEELTQFAYSASHDLKAPLASIAGALRICQEDLRDGSADEVFTNLARSQQMAERLAQRIEDMLSLARTDQFEDNLEQVSVQATVDDEWATVGGTVLDDDVELTTDYRHEEPLLTVRVRFSAIVENLLSNAWKYRDPTKGRPVIAVGTRSTDDMFILTVRDNGIGIPEDCHHKVFKLFQRFSHNNSPGSGLGLALVQKNARQLGGNVTFESSPAGTTFTVTLPRRPVLTQQEAAE